MWLYFSQIRNMDNVTTQNGDRNSKTFLGVNILKCSQLEGDTDRKFGYTMWTACKYSQGNHIFFLYAVGFVYFQRSKTS